MSNQDQILVKPTPDSVRTSPRERERNHLYNKWANPISGSHRALSKTSYDCAVRRHLITMSNTGLQHIPAVIPLGGLVMSAILETVTIVVLVVCLGKLNIQIPHHLRPGSHPFTLKDLLGPLPSFPLTSY